MENKCKLFANAAVITKYPTHLNTENILRSDYVLSTSLKGNFFLEYKIHGLNVVKSFVCIAVLGRLEIDSHFHMPINSYSIRAPI